MWGHRGLKRSAAGLGLEVRNLLPSESAVIIGPVIVMLSILFAFPLLAGGSLTAVLAMLFQDRRIAARPAIARAVLIGSITPFVMVAYGLYQAWPWPWSRPKALHDGFGTDGSMFVISGALVWIGCIIVSWVILRPLAKGNGA